MMKPDTMNEVLSGFRGYALRLSEPGSVRMQKPPYEGRCTRRKGDAMKNLLCNNFIINTLQVSALHLRRLWHYIFYTWGETSF